MNHFFGKTIVWNLQKQKESTEYHKGFFDSFTTNMVRGLARGWRSL